MKRIYCNKGRYLPANDTVNKEWLVLAFMERKAKETLNEDDFEIYITYLHKSVREIFGIPDKRFAFILNNDETEASIITWPIKPDSSRYKIYMDEELKMPYILVEDEEGNIPENKCKDCIHNTDSISNNKEIINTIIDNCACCKRGVIEESKDNFKDLYTKRKE